MIIDGFRCPCCKIKLRTRPHNTRIKRKDPERGKEIMITGDKIVIFGIDMLISSTVTSLYASALK